MALCMLRVLRPVLSVDNHDTLGVVGENRISVTLVRLPALSCNPQRGNRPVACRQPRFPCVPPWRKPTNHRYRAGRTAPVASHRGNTRPRPGATGVPSLQASLHAPAGVQCGHPAELQPSPAHRSDQIVPVAQRKLLPGSHKAEESCWSAKKKAVRQTRPSQMRAIRHLARRAAFSGSASGAPSLCNQRPVGGGYRIANGCRPRKSHLLR